MTFTHPAGLFLLGLIVPVVLLHVLRPRREPVTVSSTFLWRQVETPVSAAVPWQRLRWSLLLLAQLLAVILGALAVARPVRVEQSAFASHTVFIVDASGSMAAVDGGPDRLEGAKDRAVALRDELPTGGTASIVVAADRPRVVLTENGDADRFAQALRTVSTTAARPDFPAVFALAASLDTGATDVGYVFLTDGGLDADEAAALPPGTRVERIGSSDTNRAIQLLSVEPRGSALHAVVTVANTGGPAATQNLRIDVDGVTAAEQEVTIEQGTSIDVEVDLPNGQLVEAFLAGGDLLAADDRAVAVASPRPELTVLLVGSRLFWEELLTSIPNVVVDAVDEATTAEGYDLAVFNGVDLPAEVGAPFLAVAPPSGLAGSAGSGGIVVDGTVELPVVTLVEGDDPLLEGIDVSGVDIATAQHLVVSDAEVLVAGEDAPLLVRGKSGEHRFLYLAFDLRDSDLPVQVAFPLWADRAVAELAGLARSADALRVGDPLPVDVIANAEVVAPDGRTTSFEAGRPAPRATRTGFWTIRRSGSSDVVVAVNAPTAESDLAVADLTAAPAAPGTQAAERAAREVALLPWIVWPLVAVLVLETWLSGRRRGVRRAQWWVAVAARLVVIALLVGALTEPVISRAEDRVATVFVLDASASVGAGAASASEFVEAGFAARSDDDLAGLVVFGADAEVDRVVEASSAWSAPSVVVDDSATDIASALRVAAAMLPSDARGRIVLVSDGRPTAGETEDQLLALADAGIPVDVHTVDVTATVDASVAHVDTPLLARVNDEVSIAVSVNAAGAGPATLTLHRDGAEIARMDVELVEGANVVELKDEIPDEPGVVLRYDASVDMEGDTVPENDAGFGGVTVAGAARVLVVEGTPGESRTLVGALDAASMDNVVVDPADLPSVDVLAGYSAVVLVDVDAHSLEGEQIEALTTAVRDLGVGLVTIGGPRSYGVGGYRQSPLSDLLPVDSEVVDPKRLRTVAEVLSIDTSGSMSACHCREGSMGPGGMPTGPIMEGGVDKTDISRAAAARTIEALGENDEVGVLAWNANASWVIELQRLPPDDVVEKGLRSLRPEGMTNMSASLANAADALRGSTAELKHIILFTDGFTDPMVINRIADEAADLWEEGISVSVLGTGEGASPLLEEIAIAGHGRYYPGTDLEEVPQIMAEEAVVASRDFITEGEFLPEVTSDDEVVDQLTSAPPLLGYVATTAKAQASTLLRIGPDRDPLLATWQAGLGRSTSWTSDVTDWTATWATWPGFVDFWSRVVKDTFRVGEIAGAATATIDAGDLRIQAESTQPFPAGAVGVASIAGPDGQSVELPLERTGETTFAAEMPVARSGTYAVGVTVLDATGGVVLASNTLANESYPAEYLPGSSDAQLMARVSEVTEGRGEIAAEQAFDDDGLPAATRRSPLQGLFLWAAVALWAIAVLLSRVPLRRPRRRSARRAPPPERTARPAAA